MKVACRAKRAVADRTRRTVLDQTARLTRMGQTGLAATAIRRATGRPVNTVPAFWFTGQPNFGDILSEVLLREIWGIKPVRVSASFSGKALGLGSILHRAVSGDVVWGSGLIEPQKFDGRGIEFTAVRGPRTRSCIVGDVPELYGDPGVLLPTFYTPRPLARRYEVGVVPHAIDKEAMAVADGEVLSIDIEERDWRLTVDRIAACDVVVSSSLHGIIVAEAYGIPAVWVQPTNGLKGGRFKFNDYYEGTDRDASLADWRAGLASLTSRADRPRGVDVKPLLTAVSHALRSVGAEGYVSGA
jgi:pyruvyltransferase